MKRRPKPPNILARHAAPGHLFVAGAVTIVAFLFQGNLVVRVIQVLAFAGLATMAGKRIRWGYFLIMVSSITLFHLITPVGRVLAEFGPIAVTEGALRQGLLKGFAIVGLVFISLFAVRPDLKLPGSFGGLLARLFYHFERVLDTRKRVRARELVASIDGILMELYPLDGNEEIVSDDDGGPDSDTPSADATSPTDRTDWFGAAILITTTAASIVLAVLF
jgi:heptaprenyl diphosphate synthase